MNAQAYRLQQMPFIMHITKWVRNRCRSARGTT